MGTREEANALRALGSKLLGYPRAGTHVGRGRHVALGAPPAPGEAKPGWTTFDREPVPIYSRTPVDIDDPGEIEGWEIEVDAYEAGSIADDARPAITKRLTGQERGAFMAFINSGKVITREPSAAPGLDGAGKQ